MFPLRTYHVLSWSFFLFPLSLPSPPNLLLSCTAVTIGSGLFPGVYELPETFLGQLAVSGSGVTLGVSQATATINDMNIFSDLNSHIACAWSIWNASMIRLHIMCGYQTFPTMPGSNWIALRDIFVSSIFHKSSYIIMYLIPERLIFNFAIEWHLQTLHVITEMACRSYLLKGDAWNGQA